MYWCLSSHLTRFFCFMIFCVNIRLRPRPDKTAWHRSNTSPHISVFLESDQCQWFIIWQSCEESKMEIGEVYDTNVEAIDGRPTKVKISQHHLTKIKTWTFSYIFEHLLQWLQYEVVQYQMGRFASNLRIQTPPIGRFAMLLRPAGSNKKTYKKERHGRPVSNLSWSHGIHLREGRLS